MRALVTGASGFLGGCLAELLAGQGAEVRVLLRSGTAPAHLAGVDLEVVEGDLANTSVLRRATEGRSHIFHCAACSTDWAPWERYVAANVTGTQNLLAAAEGTPGLERFVHVSTTDVYGYPQVTGDERLPLVETVLPYNRTKIAGERAVWAAAGRGVPVTVVRPGTIFGPRGKDFTVEMAGLLRARLMALVGSGAAAGGFVYVADVAEMMVTAARSDAAVGQAYNVTDGSGASWAEYLRLFATALGVPSPWIRLSSQQATLLARLLEAPHRLGLPGKPLLTQHAVLLLGRSQEFSPEKARRELGWQARVGIEDGIARSVAWLRQRAVTDRP